MWDFETDPQYQELLDWADEFVTTEVEPLDLIWPHLQFTPLDEARRKVVGPLKEHEDKLTPQAGPWARIIKESGAQGIYFSDHPDLMFNCPEWSHLSGPDSVEFTKRLVPYLKTALAK